MAQDAADARTLADAIRETEEKYRFLTETIPVQIWTSLPDGRLDYVSHQTAGYFGLTPEQLLADGWQNVVHPEDLPTVVDRWTSSLSTGEPYEVEFRLKAADGRYAWHLGRAVPQRDASGALIRWFGTNTNIEEQRAQRARVESLLERLREKRELLALEADVGAVLSRADALDAALQSCAEAVVGHTGVAFARIWTTSGDGKVLELQASAGLYTHKDGAHARVPVGMFKIGLIAHERQAHCTNDVVGDPRVGDQAWAQREGMVSFVGHPIVFGDEVLGVIAAFARHPASDPMVQTMATVASALAPWLQRRKAEEKLRLSEQWLSTTLTSIGDGVIATDASGRVTFLNPVATYLTGWSTDAALGQPLDTVFPILNEETRATVESPVTKVLREGTIVGMANHTILLHRDGRELPIADSAAPIRDPDGHLQGVVLVFRDAGEERRVDAERQVLLAREARARREAEAARADLHSLFMQAPAPICILRGPEHTFTLANPAYMELVGRGRTIVGLPVREALPELEGQPFYEKLDRVYETGERFVGNDLPVRLDRAAGGTLEDAFVSFVYEAWRDGEGQIGGILVFAFDVTASVRSRQLLEGHLAERGRLLADAEDARTKADTASRAKDEFLAVASHELRTPLNAILGWARLLRGGTVDPSAFIRGLETIERNAKIQVQLVDDILDGSRIITGNLRLEVAPTDLNAVVDAAIGALIPAATAKAITLSVDLEPSSGQILADADRLQQVVWNLVTNAVKFTPKGGRIDVRVSRAESMVALTVKDTGQGISPEFLPHVFDRFRQADGSSTRRAGGLGLGLALVRHLVEAHGGSVRVESAGAGQGSTFFVSLPIRAVFPEEAESLRPERLDASARVSLPAVSLAGSSVLVVDDEADARELVATLLRAQGASVEVADSANAALLSLDQRRPDVIVSDVGMPAMDGHSLLRAVRARSDGTARVPAIALTAYAREEDRRRAQDAGFQRYLAKPADPAALVRMIAELVAGQRRDAEG